MKKRVAALERELREISERHALAELDAAWTVSRTRKLLVFLFAYVFLAILLLVSGVKDPFVNALPPTAIFIAATIVLGFAREKWVRTVFG